jgi:hypothetical protein
MNKDKSLKEINDRKLAVQKLRELIDKYSSVKLNGSIC